MSTNFLCGSELCTDRPCIKALEIKISCDAYKKYTLLSLVSACGAPCKNKYSAGLRCAQEANVLVCKTESHEALLLDFIRL